MSDYNELYQQIILEHNKKPRNFKKLESPDAKVSLGKNPLCGDHYYVMVDVADDGTITDIGFQGDGCAISKASASMMTKAVVGKKKDEALQMRTEFHRMLTEDLPADHHLGKLTILSGVKDYPVRVKCALLPWTALKDAVARAAAAPEEENP